MLGFSSNCRIFICKEPVDMRNGFEGLSSIVAKIFKTKIASGAIFVFINKRKNLMKILYWDRDGLAIWYKRLEKGRFLNNNKSLLDRREFLMLLEGIVPKRLERRFFL